MMVFFLPYSVLLFSLPHCPYFSARVTRGGYIAWLVFGMAVSLLAAGGFVNVLYLLFGRVFLLLFPAVLIVPNFPTLRQNTLENWLQGSE